MFYSYPIKNASSRTVRSTILLTFYLVWARKTWNNNLHRIYLFSGRGGVSAMGRFSITVLKPMKSPKKYFKTNFTQPLCGKFHFFLFCCWNHALQMHPNFSVRPSRFFLKVPSMNFKQLIWWSVIFYARHRFVLRYFFKFKASRKLSILAHFRLKQHFSWLTCPSMALNIAICN